MDDGVEVGVVDVELDEDASTRFERSAEQRPDLLHGLALLRLFVGSRIGDQLGERHQDRVEHLEAGGAQRAARLGDLDDGVGDVGHLGLGGAVRQLDVGVDAVLRQVPLGQLGVLGVHPGPRREVLDRLRGRVGGDGEDDADGAGGRLGVVQLGEGHDFGVGLLDPVPSGDAQVERARRDVPRDLLRSEDPHAVDARVVNVGAVVDVGAPLDREIGVFEQLERRSLQRALRQHQAEHVFVSLAPCEPGYPARGRSLAGRAPSARVGSLRSPRAWRPRK